MNLLKINDLVCNTVNGFSVVPLKRIFTIERGHYSVEDIIVWMAFCVMAVH